MVVGEKRRKWNGKPGKKRKKKRRETNKKKKQKLYH